MVRERLEYPTPDIVDRATFQAGVDAVRMREKAHTREGDAIAAARRRLPMVKVDGDTPLIGDKGSVTLLEAFEGRRMLIAYYYMWFDGRPAPEQGADFYRAAGWDEAQIAGYRREFGQFGRAVSPLPAGYVRMREGERLSIGGRDWRVVVGEGHSPEHACLWREEDGVVLGGDQILPRYPPTSRSGRPRRTPIRRAAHRGRR